MDFPTLVYRCPGDHRCQGGTYRYAAVQDADELEGRLASGWFASLPEAMAGEPAISDAAPTRAEIEQKAAELGIKFDGRTGDATLLRRINEALEA